MALYWERGIMALLTDMWDMAVLSISGDMAIVSERSGNGFIWGKEDMSILREKREWLY